MIHLAIIFKAHHVDYCVKQHLDKDKYKGMDKDNTSKKGIRSTKTSHTSIILMYEVLGSPSDTEMNIVTRTNMTVRLTTTVASKKKGLKKLEM